MDSIANAFCTLRNSQAKRKQYVLIPFSTVVWNILLVLYIEGFLVGFCHEGRNIKVHLKYTSSVKDTMTSPGTLQKLTRISKLGHRVYTPYKSLPNAHLGLFLLSTSKGIVTDRDARWLKQGGEILGYVV